MKRLDRWLGVVLLVSAGLWTWVVQVTVPGPQAVGEPGPRLFPLLLGGALALLALAVLAATIRPAGAPSAEDAGPARPDRHEVWVVSATFALLLVYAFLMERIGFVLATPLVLVLALAGILRQRNWRGILALAVGFTAGCHLIFNVLLQANLPRGNWIHLF